MSYACETREELTAAVPITHPVPTPLLCCATGPHAASGTIRASGEPVLEPSLPELVVRADRAGVGRAQHHCRRGQCPHGDQGRRKTQTLVV